MSESPYTRRTCGRGRSANLAGCLQSNGAAHRYGWRGNRHVGYHRASGRFGPEVGRAGAAVDAHVIAGAVRVIIGWEKPSSVYAG